MAESMGLVSVLYAAEGVKKSYGSLSPKACEIFYALVKLASPKVAVETGVSAGVSSAMILSAVESVEGRVLSIDINENAGWLIPHELKPRWTLLIGPSRKILPNLLSDQAPIDFFFHDSDHSYENMMFEFHEAWKALRSGGMLVSHDISVNTAFRDFASEIGLKRLELIDFGVVRKS
jgi:predicted O-methyltransferase YrrM